MNYSYCYVIETISRLYHVLYLIHNNLIIFVLYDSKL